MAEIIWTKSAISDLDEIAEYIAIDKLNAANKLVTNITNLVDRLAIFPESGRLLPEFNNTIYREIIVNPCRIIYYSESDKVYITRIIRSERQLRRYMLTDVIHETDEKYNLD